MEVVPLPGAGAHDGPESGTGALKLPFQRHNIEEWSRLDRLTGMLEHARVETNHWSANTSNASHNYGKVVDQRARNLADGSVQQRQRKQMEVFESHVPGGSMQVIRTQSITTSSSSSSLWRGVPQLSGSRWSSRTAGALGSTADTSGPDTPTPAIADSGADFENLQLALNPLDLSSQKTKASVGRSGSIGGRRPPSRPRSLIGRVGSAISEEAADAPISRICQQIHEETKKRVLGFSSDEFFSNAKHFDDDLEVEVSAPRIEFPPSDDDKTSSGSLKSVRLVSNGVASTNSAHSVIGRKKSCSSEDLTKIDSDIRSKSGENDDNDSVGSWNRGSKVRRSLQYPSSSSKVPADFPIGTSVSKIRQEIESRKMGGSYKNQTPNEVTALEGVLKRVMGKGSIFDTASTETGSKTEHETETSKETMLESVKRMAEKDLESKGLSSSSSRHSFVTVESLKEVRGKLRRMSSDHEEAEQNPSPTPEAKRSHDDNDDGIVTEDHVLRPSAEVSTPEVSPSRVKTYVFGMESMLNGSQNTNKKPIVGTGSLESRTSNKLSSVNGARSEEWYSRRKSYGFEQVHSQQSEDSNHLKSKVESSTDSGICRSSETVSVPPWTKVINGLKSPQEETDLTPLTKLGVRRPASFNEGMPKPVKTFLLKKVESEDDDKISFTRKTNYTSDGHIVKGQKTIVKLGTFASSADGDKKSEMDRRREVLTKSVERDHLKFPNSNGWNGHVSRAPAGFLTQSTDVRRLSEPVTITIPIVANDSCTVRPTDLTGRKGLLKPVTDTIPGKSEGSWMPNGFHHPDEHSAVEPNQDVRTEWPHHFTWTSRDKLSDSNEVVMRGSKSPSSELKRHSIAVDESKYVQDDLKTLLDNDAYKKSEPVRRHMSSAALQLRHNVKSMDVGSTFMAHDFDDANPTHSDSQDDAAQGRKKKVEFCKTEVHFAAEPGRFNLVSTDDKPPPSQIVRGRRRNKLLAEQKFNKSGLPEIRFGDSVYEKKLLAHEDVGESPSTQAPEGRVPSPISVEPSVNTIRVVPESDTSKEEIITDSNATIEVTEHQLPEDKQEQPNLLPDGTNSDDSKPRSILKSYSKPQEYFLGEEPSTTIPNTSSTPMWRSTVTLRNTSFGVKPSYDSPEPTEKLGTSTTISNDTSPGEAEFQRLLKNLRPTGVKKNLPETTDIPPSTVDITVSTGPGDIRDTRKNTWAVTDDVRTRTETKGFSTKINFGGGEATIVQLTSDDEPAANRSATAPGLYQQTDRPKPIWLRREERKLEAMHKHQDTQSKLRSTVVRIGASRRGLLSSEVIKSQRRFGSVSGIPKADQPMVHTRLKSTPLVMGANMSLSTDNDDSSDADDAATDEEVVVPSQLAVLKQMFRYDDADLSDDSLKADAEVRAYMAGDLEEACSEVSGSWSRLRAARNVRRHLTATNTRPPRHAHKPEYPDVEPRVVFSSSAVRKPKGVETLVGTKEGHPKITSISLRYDGDTTLRESRFTSGASTTFTHSEATPGRKPSPTTVFIQPERRRSASADRSSSSTHLRDRRRDLTPDRVLSPLRDTYSPNHEARPPPVEEVVLVSPGRARSRSPAKEQRYLKERIGYTENKEYNERKHREYREPRGHRDYNEDPSRRENTGLAEFREQKEVKGRKTYRGVSPILVNDKNVSLEQLKISQQKETFFGSDSRQCSRRSSNDSTGKDPVAPQLRVPSNRHQASCVEKEILHEDKVGRAVETSHQSSELKQNEHAEYKKDGRMVSPPKSTHGDSKLLGQRKDREVEKAETESGILEELTRAADEIMKAVNGYTDEDSYRASSEDDDDPRRRRRGVPVKTTTAALSTINETRATSATTKECKRGCQSKVVAERKTQTRMNRARVRPTSSNSSLESISRDTAAVRTVNGRKGSGASSSEASVKTSARTARLMQRANSRELLMKSRGSSSEDIPTGDLADKRTQRVVRRTRTHYTAIETPVAQIMRTTRDKERDSTTGTHRSSTASSRTSRPERAERTDGKEYKDTHHRDKRERDRADREVPARTRRTSSSSTTTGPSKHHVSSSRRVPADDAGNTVTSSSSSRHPASHAASTARLIGAERLASNGSTATASTHASRRKANLSTHAQHPRPFK